MKPQLNCLWGKRYRYIFFWIGYKEDLSDMVIPLAEKWMDRMRQSEYDRIIKLRIALFDVTVSVISVNVLHAILVDT